MRCTSFDLTIEEAMADPVIGAAMRADKVEPRHVEALLRGVARQRGVAEQGGATSRGTRTGGMRAALHECLSW